MTWTMFVMITLLAMGTQGVHSVLTASSGPCPQPPVQDDFDVINYQGTWYEYERFWVPYEALVKCGQANYQLMNSSSPDIAIQVNNTGIRELRFWNYTIYRSRTSAIGVATVPDPAVPAKLVVRFGGKVMSFFTRADYWVLSTDYTTYALVYSCSPLFFDYFHYDSAWILTRDRGVTPDNLEFLRSLLRDYDIDPDKFEIVDQSDCEIV